MITTLLQLMALPAACMIFAWLRAAGAHSVTALLHGVAVPAAIARPTLARVPHRLPSCGLPLAGSSPRARRARHVRGARSGSLPPGGVA
jgi:hypothetical protein